MLLSRMCNFRLENTRGNVTEIPSRSDQNYEKDQISSLNIQITAACIKIIFVVKLYQYMHF